MKRSAGWLSLFLLLLPFVAAPTFLKAQVVPPASKPTAASTSPARPAQAAKPAKVAKKEIAQKPFSQFALGGGISTFGINMQAATNLDRHLNLRATGNVFNYTASNISTNGFNIGAKLNMATAGVSLDYYPIPTLGLRVSPGVQLYNGTSASGTFQVQPGTSFTLDNYTYYASTTNPIGGVGSVGLHSVNPAFTLTTGWGNIIPRKGGHWSYPVEVGVAFVGSPAVNIALNSGQVCDAFGKNCVDIATDQSVQTNLQAQVAKYKSDLDPLKTYPIFSVGVAYNFKVR